MKIERINGEYAVCKVSTFDGIDLNDEFTFTASTDGEKSLVCLVTAIPPTVYEAEKPWAMFRISDQLDFSLVGILAKFSSALANADIPLFAISTFNTDYILVLGTDADKAESVLVNVAESWQSQP